jgi:hypothetical protein
MSQRTHDAQTSSRMSTVYERCVELGVPYFSPIEIIRACSDWKRDIHHGEHPRLKRAPLLGSSDPSTEVNAYDAHTHGLPISE